MASRLLARLARPAFALALAALSAVALAGTAVAAPPVATSAPAITGGVRVLDVVTCTPGAWDQPATFTFEWLLDGTVIAGEASADYRLRGTDRAHAVTCRVTASTAEPAAASATSAALSPRRAIQTVTARLLTSKGIARACGVNLAKACIDSRHAGGSIRVGGVLAPVRVGARVVVLLERQRSSLWVLSMSRTATIQSNGSYSITIPARYFAATGWRIRTRVPETDVYDVASSPLRFVRVTS